LPQGPLHIQCNDCTNSHHGAAVNAPLLNCYAWLSCCAGFEARGLIFGAPLALALNCAFVPLRKPGKLPGRVLCQQPQLAAYDAGSGIGKLHFLSS